MPGLFSKLAGRVDRPSAPCPGSFYPYPPTHQCRIPPVRPLGPHSTERRPPSSSPHSAFSSPHQSPPTRMGLPFPCEWHSDPGRGMRTPPTPPSAAGRHSHWKPAAVRLLAALPQRSSTTVTLEDTMWCRIATGRTDAEVEAAAVALLDGDTHPSELPLIPPNRHCAIGGRAQKLLRSHSAGERSRVCCGTQR